MKHGTLFLARPPQGAGWQPPALVATGWDIVSGALEQQPPDHCRVGLLLLEGRLPGCEALERWLARTDRLPWVALVAAEHMGQPALTRLLRQHCMAQLPLPPGPERLLLCLRQASAHTGESVEGAGSARLVGQSPGARQLMHAIRKVAKVDAPVLLLGESGTGKELAAVAVHAQSRRAAGPFVAVNCGALPMSLIQSELFGHERGAFTGAQQRKIGRIEAASRGTIFLDEIGDLALDLQANLLRFLQEGTVERVGGSGPIPVDARVVAATHVDLERAVQERRFRADLYYRLNVLRLELPPLRERREDIPLLAEYFFHRFAADRAPLVRGFGLDALEAMARHPWPGNVRELLNRVRRALIMCEGRWISPRDLGLEGSTPRLPTLAEARFRAERTALEQALAATRHNISHAASLLGVSRVTLYRLMEKHRLTTPGPAWGREPTARHEEGPELASL